MIFNGLALPKHNEQLQELLRLNQAETGEIEIGLTRDGHPLMVLLRPSVVAPQNDNRTPTPVLSANDYL